MLKRKNHINRLTILLFFSMLATLTQAQVYRLELQERVSNGFLDISIIFRNNTTLNPTDTLGRVSLSIDANPNSLDIQNAALIMRGKWDASISNQYKPYELFRNLQSVDLIIDRRTDILPSVRGIPFSITLDTIARIRIPIKGCVGGSGVRWSTTASNVVTSQINSWTNLNIRNRFAFQNPSGTVNLTTNNFVNFNISSSRGDTICSGFNTLLTVDLETTTLADTAKYSFRWNTYATADTLRRLSATQSYKYEVTVIEKATQCQQSKSRNVVVRQKPQLCIRVVKRQGFTILRDYGYDTTTTETIVGRAGSSGDQDGTGTAALLNRPSGLFYNNGFLYVADRDNHKVKRVNLTNFQVQTLIGNGVQGLTDGLPPLVTSLNQPNGIAIDKNRNIIISNLAGNSISKWDAQDNLVYLIAGPNTGVSGHLDGNGDVARFNQPRELDVDAFGNVYVSDYNNHVVRKLAPLNKSRYSTTSVLGRPNTTGFLEGIGDLSRLNSPFGLAVNKQGSIMVADELNHTVRIANLNFNLRNFSGIGTQGNYPSSAQDGKIAGRDALFRQPWSIAVGEDGVGYLADANNRQIKKIDQKGNVSLLAGRSGIVGNANGGVAQATFNGSAGIAVDENGVVYVADRESHTIRKISRNKTITMCSSDAGLVDMEAFCGWESISGNYEWSWVLQRPSRTDSVVGNSSSAKITHEGRYIVRISQRTGNLCTDINSDTIFVKFTSSTNIAIQGAAGTTITRCVLDSTTIRATPGFQTYRWEYRVTSQPTVVLQNNSPNFAISSVRPSSSITVRGTDFSGCESQAAANFVTVGIDFNLTTPTSQICQGDSIQIQATTTTVVGNALYTWPTGSRLISTTGTVNAQGYTEVYRVPVPNNDSIAVVGANRLTLLGVQAGACRNTKKILVNVNPAPQLNVSNDTALCGGVLGQIDLAGSAISQFNPIQTKWYNASNPTDAVNGNSRTVSPTSSTSFVFEARDAINCVARDTVRIGVANTVMAASLSFTQDTLICPNSTIDLLATGSLGTPFQNGSPYTYLWSTNNNSDFTILPSKESRNPSVSPTQNTTYRVVVKDSLGCSDAKSVNVNIVEFRIDNKSPKSDTSICFGQNINLNQNATIINQRGGPYIFNWNQTAPILSQNNILAPVASPRDTTNPTEYILRISDLGGCTIFDTINVVVNRLPKAEINSVNSICTGKAMTLTGNASNTVAPYSFLWSEPNTQAESLLRNDTSAVLAIPPTAQPVATGTVYTYNLVVTDANGCQSNQISKPVTALLTPVLSFQNKNLVGCLGTPLQVDARSPENGTMVLSYLWTNGSTTSNDAQKTITESGDYIITVTESSTNAGCQKRDTINVRFDKPISGLALLTRDQICKNDTLPMTASLIDGDFPITFDWEVSGGFGNFSKNTTNEKEILTDTIVYRPVLSDPSSVTVRVTAKNVCNELSESKIVLLNDVPNAQIQNAPVEVFVNTPATFTQNSTGFDQLFWNFKDGTPLLQDNGQSVTHTFTDNGIYFVTLTATNLGGCSSKDSVRLEVIRNQILFIPNVFSPDAKDLQNQALRVYGMNIQSQEFDFIVFNKWGEIVYETNDYLRAYAEGWNGKFKNTGADQALGVYTYSVRGKFLDGSKFEKVGTVTLLR